MNTQHGHNRRPIRQLPLARRFAPVVVAFLATLVGAAPAFAVTFPNVPLQSGSAFPAPNIMFILDDSGSMARDYMPDSVPSVSPDDIRYLTYSRNGLSYNPANTYKAWIKFDGTRYNTGTAYNSAWDDDNHATSGDTFSGA